MSSSNWPLHSLHPAQQRYLAEDLVRLRRSDERRRYAAPQRAAKVDANPHQIQAVIFALSRLREGGCILADEVGLGKTIETGLVLAQLLAEGATRVLLIAPKALIGQWKHELFTLFDLEADEADISTLAGPGIKLVGREFAGSERGSKAIFASGSFDLCVIDEAHEVFANIYKRFDKNGEYREDAPVARTAGRVRDLLHSSGTPTLLLTATPIQNNLAELWGLIQYVDPMGTLLGPLPIFREMFCAADDRGLADGQEFELRARLKTVVQRTLRQHAQEFLERPFVDRQARTFEYRMSPNERALYDDVSAYLLEPQLAAFRSRSRQLLLIGFRRRMASSTPALTASLKGVVRRLRELAGESSTPSESRSTDDMDDLEDTDITEVPDEDIVHNASVGDDSALAPAAIRHELNRVQGFVQRAERLLEDDSKLRALLQAITFVGDQEKAGKSSGKVLIFTESKVTQNYLRQRLVESGIVKDADITLFNGDNSDARADAALKRWHADIPHDGLRPSADVATRLALIHEFATRSRVFISTEAGAKGLNLQFCDTVVNYDLPWNPQRIEQRIGRCHRYGQTHTVTVINFLAADNEAQQLTFDILSRKLELFGTVLSASDEVLHHGSSATGERLASALGPSFESELRKIYERSRTLDEVTKELRNLRETMDDRRRRFEEAHAHTATLIEENLDADVRRVFKQRKEDLRGALAEFDRDLRHLVLTYLDASSIDYRCEATEDGELLHVSASAHLPPMLRDGVDCALGFAQTHTSLSLRHPLVVAAVADSRERSVGDGVVVVSSAAEPTLAPLAGKSGTLRVVKATFDGFEKVERLIPFVLFGNDEDPVVGQVAEAILRAPMLSDSTQPRSGIETAALDDAASGLLFRMQQEVDPPEQERFEHADRQAERFVADRLLFHRRRQKVAQRRADELRQRQEGATSATARSSVELDIVKHGKVVDEIESVINRLEVRDDAPFQSYQDHIQRRRYTPPTIMTLFDLELVVQ